ncbi:DNA cytosine methyltransferase [Flavitalea antarctica]
MNFIDLFAGAGGLSEGFIASGFTPVAHVEIDAAACFTLKTRTAYHHLKDEGKLDIYHQYLKKEIDRGTLYSHVPKEKLDGVINLPIGEKNNRQIHKQISQQLGGSPVDLVIGGPPCQAYSLVGRARSKDGMEGDPRNFLYVEYAKYLEKYNPKFFVFENVMGLLSADKGSYLKAMQKLFKKKGYSMELFKVEATAFGVLQNRKRVLIIGWKDDFKPSLPMSSLKQSTKNFYVQDLFNDLPKIAAGQGRDRFDYYVDLPSQYLNETAIREKDMILTQHISRPQTEQDKLIYEIAVRKWSDYEQRLNYNDLPARLKTHANRVSFFDRFKVVAGNLHYSQTVVAHIAKDGHYYIHPDLEQNRSISVREAARLQSFPDNYYFEGVKEYGNRTAAFRQIGNAVPPLMATQISKNVLNY